MNETSKDTKADSGTASGDSHRAAAADNGAEVASEAAESGCEVMFYHLTAQPLEQVLPVLLHKTLQRGWRAVVRCGNPLRLRPISDAIWSWRDDSFIAHGLLGEGHEEAQPVLLISCNAPEPQASGAAATGATGETDAGDNGAQMMQGATTEGSMATGGTGERSADGTEEATPAPNGARILFCVDGALPPMADLARFERICVLFPQADAAQLEQARALWRTLRQRQDVRLTYWQQEPGGGWQRKA